MLILHIIAACVTFIVVFSIIRGEFSNQIEIYYYGNNSSSYQGDLAQVYYNYGNGYQESESSVASIFKRLAGFNYQRTDQELQSVRIDFSNSTEKIGIARLEIRSGIFSIYSVGGKELVEKGFFPDIKNSKWRVIIYGSRLIQEMSRSVFRKMQIMILSHGYRKISGVKSAGFWFGLFC